ncbi:MAG: hypothetical protein AABZ53_09835 [Planctomycetota bacterium]
MDERKLTSLLNMAREAEELDRDVNAPGAIRHAARVAPRDSDRPAHRVARSGKDGARRVIWMSLASAACLALTITAWTFFGLRPTGSTSPAPDPHRFAIGTAPVSPLGGVDAGTPASNRQTMLIALYRGDDGRGATCADCWCVQRWVPTLEDEQELSGVTKDEMICASMDRTCVKDPARVVVVGLSGPAELLPASDDTARDIAICLMEYQDSKSEPDTLDATIAALASAGCVASSVDVHIHSWAR